MQQKNKKRKWLSILLILAMVLSMFPQTGLSWLLPVTAAAAETGTENVAPAPKFFSTAWDLSTQSTTMYTDSSIMLRIRFEKNTSAHTKDTLDIEWQVSDDGEKFTAIENPNVTWEEDWYRSTLYPEQEFGTTKYYRAKVTNKGLKEGMTPSTIYSEVATIKAVNEEEPGYILNMPVVRKADGSFETDPNIKVEITAPKVTDYTKDPLGRGNSYTKNSGFLGMMPDTWDHDLYRFVGWKVGNQVCDGTKEKSEAPTYKPTEEKDLYTWFEADEYTTDANVQTTFTVYGASIMNSSDTKLTTAAPAGATVTIFDANGENVGTTTVGEDGTFGITFASDGIYTILVSGLSTYTCETYGGGAANTYTDATVVPSWCTVKVGNVPEEPEYVKGDVNNDGYIDMIDVVQLQDAVTEESEVVLDVCDINGDGFVDMIDVVQLQDMVTEAE